MVHAGFSTKASVVCSNKLSLHNISLKWPILWCFSATLILFYKALKQDYHSLHCPLVQLWRSAFCSLVFSWFILKDRFGSWEVNTDRCWLVCLCYSTNQAVENPTTVQGRYLLQGTYLGIKRCASSHPSGREVILWVHFRTGLDYLLFWTLMFLLFSSWDTWKWTWLFWVFNSSESLLSLHPAPALRFRESSSL